MFLSWSCVANAKKLTGMFARDGVSLRVYCLALHSILKERKDNIASECKLDGFVNSADADAMGSDISQVPCKMSTVSLPLTGLSLIL